MKNYVQVLIRRDNKNEEGREFAGVSNNNNGEIWSKIFIEHTSDDLHSSSIPKYVQRIGMESIKQFIKTNSNTFVIQVLLYTK